MYKVLLAGLAVLLVSAVPAAELETAISAAMGDLEVRVSPKPYSRTIERMYIGYDRDGHPKTGIAVREIESYKPLSGVVIVDKTDTGYVLREALFPDINRIRKPKDRQEIAKLLKHFQHVPFNPHAEHSAVDVVSGATRYTAKTAGYFNYMARQTALKMEAHPNWDTLK